MKKYSHDFVETYDGFLGFGWERETDEQTLICYLQMISDDRLIKTLVSRMSDHELEESHDFINRLLRTHLNDAEYHRLFLKDNTH
ncbi:MAG: cytoplasmic protein [Desulfobacterales bacterium]